MANNTGRVPDAPVDQGARHSSGCLEQWYNSDPGDDWLRRRRLVPDCEPRGADLVNSAQTIKCQPH